MKPRKRLSGMVLVGFVIFALILSFGAVALTDGVDSVQRAVFDRSPDNLQIDRVSVDDWNDEIHYRKVYGYNTAALTDYLAALEVQRVYAGNYEEGAGRKLYVDYAEMADGEAISFTRFALYGELLFVNIPYDDRGTIAYLLKEQPDWAYLDSLLDFEAEDPDPAPHPPELTVTVTEGDMDADRVPLYAMAQVEQITDADGTWVLQYSERKTVQLLKEPGTEHKPTHWLYDRGEGIGGFSGVEIAQVQLGFSYEPVFYTVQVENWDRSEHYLLNGDDLVGGGLPLAPYSAHYTVRGSFETVRSTVYEMAFYFDIDLPDDAKSRS